MPKFCYLFRQSDRSTIFFGILRGVISLRINTKKRKNSSSKFVCCNLTNKIIKKESKSVPHKININMKNFTSEFEEEEVLRVSEGMCFGEWGLIYNHERSASALVVEDADIFTLDKDNFDSSLAVC